MNLQIIVEGTCEELFVKKILAPHLALLEVYTRPVPVHTSTSQRGGMTSFARAKDDITDALKRGGYVSTMFDLFRLPRTFPSFDSQPQQLESRLQHLENALKDVISDWRFIPYIQAYEFEALLFSVPSVLDSVLCNDLGCDSRLSELEKIVSQFETPEHINGGLQTAPSKRLLGLYLKYRKVLHGLDIAEQTTLPVMRQKCLHFDAWVRQLEALGSAS